MCSSPEYNTLCELTDELRLAVQSNLTNLSGALLAKHLILPAADNELRNRMHSETDCSARLVELIQMKVYEDSRQYYIFVRVLEDQGRQYYAAILDKLIQKLQVKLEDNQQDSCSSAVKHSIRDKNPRIETDKGEMEEEAIVNLKVKLTRQESQSHFSIQVIQLLSKRSLLTISILIGLIAIIYSLSAFGSESLITSSTSRDDLQSECTKIESPKALFQELKEIGSWEHLCLNLGVTSAVLNSLTHEHYDNNSKKLRCLEAFYNEDVDPDVQVCWETVVKAISTYPISNRRIAKQIAEKYL